MPKGIPNKKLIIDLNNDKKEAIRKEVNKVLAYLLKAIAEVIEKQ